MTKLPIDLPPTEQDLLGWTVCGCAGCNNQTKRNDLVLGCIKVGATTHQEHFCSNECRDTWRDYMTPGVRYGEY